MAKLTGLVFFAKVRKEKIEWEQSAPFLSGQPLSGFSCKVCPLSTDDAMRILLKAINDILDPKDLPGHTEVQGAGPLITKQSASTPEICLGFASPQGELAVRDHEEQECIEELAADFEAQRSARHLRDLLLKMHATLMRQWEQRQLEQERRAKALARRRRQSRSQDQGMEIDW